MIRLTLFLLSLLLLAPAEARAERRIALVIGNGAYQHVPVLPNPARDAGAIAALLRQLGFEAELAIDADRAALEAAIRRFGDRAAGADAAVFFYAGHAVEVGGRNYLIPVSANIRAARDLPFETLDFDNLLAQLEGRARISVILLDSCRENPFRAALGGSTRAVARAAGLAAVQSGTGTLVAYATAPGTVALDGTGEHSPFTAALLEHLPTPGLEVRQLLGRVRRAVREATNGQQIPWDTSALEGEFFFVPAVVPPPAPAPAAHAPAPRTPAGAPRGAAPPPAPGGPPPPAVGESFEGRLVLPLGTVPLPPGSWRLVAYEGRQRPAPFSYQRNSATLVAEREGRVQAMLSVRLRRALPDRPEGERTEPWPRFACSQFSILARRVALENGDRMDCLRVQLWAPVQAEREPLPDTTALFEEARGRPGWLPPTTIDVGVVVGDAAGQIYLEVHLNPMAWGFPRDERPAAQNGWAIANQDALRRACVVQLTGWGESLRAPLRQALAGEGTPSIAAPPPCRAR